VTNLNCSQPLHNTMPMAHPSHGDVLRADTPIEVDYYRNGGILPTCCGSRNEWYADFAGIKAGAEVSTCAARMTRQVALIVSGGIGIGSGTGRASRAAGMYCTSASLR
jgi:hypothetical protein